MSNPYILEPLEIVEHRCDDMPAHFRVQLKQMGKWEFKNEVWTVAHHLGYETVRPVRFCPWCAEDLEALAVPVRETQGRFV